MADFEIIDSGSIVQVIAKTESAQDWIDDNVDAPNYMWNGRVLNIEQRFADPIIEGMIADGLEPE
jgi:hypothetical protein